jgi:hypothetical protein
MGCADIVVWILSQHELDLGVIIGDAVEIQWRCNGDTVEMQWRYSFWLNYFVEV